MRDLKNNPFTGEPNDEPTEEFDKAWAHLLERESQTTCLPNKGKET